MTFKSENKKSIWRTLTVPSGSRVGNQRSQPTGVALL